MDHIKMMTLKNKQKYVLNIISYFHPEDRLSSFENWSFKEGPCSGKKMAEAGFFMVAPEVAKCFFCGKELENWEPEDDPIQEHEKHSNGCPFLKLRSKILSNSMTIRDLLILMFESELYKMVTEFKKGVQSNK